LPTLTRLGAKEFRFAATDPVAVPLDDAPHLALPLAGGLLFSTGGGSVWRAMAAIT
jgi:hypothetical protein